MARSSRYMDEGSALAWRRNLLRASLRVAQRIGNAEPAAAHSRRSLARICHRHLEQVSGGRDISDPRFAGMLRPPSQRCGTNAIDVDSVIRNMDCRK